MNKLTFKQATLASVLALVGSIPITQEAEGAIFVKIPGIKGDVIVKGHEGSIHAESWAWGSSSQGLDRKGSNLCMSEVSIAKQVDVSSARLMEEHAGGQPFDSVVVTATPDGVHDPASEMYVYEFLDAVINYLSVSGGGEGKPYENLGIKYRSVMGYIRTIDPVNGKVNEIPFKIGPNNCY